RSRDDVECRVPYSAAVAESLSERQRLPTQRFLGGGERLHVLRELDFRVVVPVTDHIERGRDELALTACEFIIRSLILLTAAPASLLPCVLAIFDPERPDLEEVRVGRDYLARLGPDIAHAGVIGDEITCLQPEILQIEGVSDGYFGEWARAVQLDHLLFSTVDAVEEFQEPDTEVVGRFGLDVDLIDESDTDIPTRRGEPHLRFRVLHDLDQVLGGRGAGRRTGGFEFDVVQATLPHLELAAQRAGRI